MPSEKESARSASRKDCPECGFETEFVQFGGAKSDTTETAPSELGDGILELRTCDRCGVGIENILTASQQRVVGGSSG